MTPLFRFFSAPEDHAMSRLPLLFLVLASALAAQQRPEPNPPVPDTLDGVLAVVVRGHPDVLLAESKLRQAEALLRQAEAEVRQARLRATRETVSLWNERRAAETEARAAEQALNAAKVGHAQGAVSVTEIRAAEDRFLKSSVALESSRAQLAGLLSAIQGAPSAADQSLVVAAEWAKLQADEKHAASVARTAAAPPRRPPLPAAVTSLLERRVDVALVDLPLPEAVRKILGDAPVNLVLEPGLRESFEDHRVTLSLKQVTLLAALTALVDQTDFAFILRDYGLRLTGASQAMTIDAPAVPESLPLER
jgi:hypothetical protein